jgi:hypothetical protein
MHDRERYCVLYTRAHLFDQPMLILQQMKQSSMECWICSVEEAIATRQCREKLHHELCQTIMGKFLVLGKANCKATKGQGDLGIASSTKNLTANTMTPVSSTGERPIAGRKARSDHKGRVSMVSQSSPTSSTSILHPIWSSGGRACSTGKKRISRCGKNSVLSVKSRTQERVSRPTDT